MSTCSSLSITISVIPNSCGTCSQHCATYCVQMLHVLRLPINCGTSTCTGESYCVVGSLLVGTMFVWAKLNVEVCLVVFPVPRVAQ